MSTVNDAPLIIDNIRPGGTRPSEAPARADQAKPAAEEEASFWDFLDIINPLQHIPVVSTIYREITGDTIKPIARLAGGALFGGGFIGAGLAAVTATAEGLMGLDDGETMLSFLFGSDSEERPPVEAGTETARQAIGAAPEGRESPAQMIARYAQPLEQMQQTAAAAQAQAAQAAQGAVLPASAVPFMLGEPAPVQAATQAAPTPAPAPEPASAFSALRQRVETSQAPQMAPPTGVMPATAATLKGPETADRSREQPSPQAPDPVRRALEAQGLGSDAASHPMIQALAAGGHVSSVPGRPSAAAAMPATGGLMAGGAAPAAATGAAPQQMPDWFDQAMSRALDRYEQTGRLNTAAARAQTHT
ncbi:hypothetical protein [Caenispirillum salinarum]|uniref:hypothetical protein n=1 Tax=Caenispirillum salinarum TaxID=859058 RepID=UPI00384B7B8E